MSGGDVGTLGTPVQEDVDTDGVNSDDCGRKSEEELDALALQFLDGGRCLIAEKVNSVNKAVEEVVTVISLEYLSEVKKNRQLNAKLEKSLRENDELRQRNTELEMGRQESHGQMEGELVGLLTAQVDDLVKRLEEKENQLTSLKGEVAARLIKSIEDQIGPNQTQGGSSSKQIGEGLHAVGGQEQLQEGTRIKSKIVVNPSYASEEQVGAAEISPKIEPSLVDPVPTKRIRVISPRKRSSSSSQSSFSDERNRVHRSPRRSREALRCDYYVKEMCQPEFKKTCPCGEAFTSREQMDTHHCHFTKRCKFICETCEHRFSDLWKLHQHLGDVHNDRLAPNQVGCKGCGKIYSAKERLWEHWRVSGCLGNPSYLF